MCQDTDIELTISRTPPNRSKWRKNSLGPGNNKLGGCRDECYVMVDRI